MWMLSEMLGHLDGSGMLGHWECIGSISEMEGRYEYTGLVIENVTSLGINL